MCFWVGLVLKIGYLSRPNKKQKNIFEREVERQRAMLEGAGLLHESCQSHPESGAKPRGFTEPSEAED